MEVKIFNHSLNKCYYTNEIEKDYNELIEKDKPSYFIYYPNYLNKDEAIKLKHYLDKQNDFLFNYNSMNTKASRLQKWYHIKNKYFCQNWKYQLPCWESFHYDKYLIQLQNKIQNTLLNNTLSNPIYYNESIWSIDNTIKTNNDNIFTINDIFTKYNIPIPNINSCLINKYRDGNDYISPHCDNYHSFGKYPTICGLSIGESRIFRVTNVKNNHKQSHGLSKKDKQHLDRNFDFILESGSLFIMAGSSQKYFSHQIMKSKSTHSRYSLTFRELIN